MTLREWHEERRRINRVVDNLTEKANKLAIVKGESQNIEQPQLIDNERLRQLWAQCENCFNMQYRKYLKQNMSICQDCGFPMQMSSSDRIELLVDQGTWYPMDENISTIDVFSDFEDFKTGDKIEIPWQINRKDSKSWIDYSWNFWVYYSFLMWEFFPQIQEFLLKEEIIEEIMKEESPIKSLMEDIEEYLENLMEDESSIIKSLMKEIKSLENLMEDESSIKNFIEDRIFLNEIKEWNLDIKDGFFNLLKKLYRVYIRQILIDFIKNGLKRHISILEKMDLESFEVESLKDEFQEILLYGKIKTLVMDSPYPNLFPKTKDPFSSETVQELPEQEASEEEVLKEEVPEDPFSEQFWDEPKALRTWEKYLEEHIQEEYIQVSNSDFFENYVQRLNQWLNWILENSDFSEDTIQWVNQWVNWLLEEEPEEEVPEEEVPEEQVPEEEVLEQEVLEQEGNLPEDYSPEWDDWDEYMITPCEDPIEERRLALQIQKLLQKLREEIKKGKEELDREDKPYMDHVTVSQIDTSLDREEKPDMDHGTSHQIDTDLDREEKPDMDHGTSHQIDTGLDREEKPDMDHGTSHQIDTDLDREEKPDMDHGTSHQIDTGLDREEKPDMDHATVSQIDTGLDREEKPDMDHGTSHQIDTDLDREEKPYMDHVTSYQIDTGLTDAIQTGIGRLNGIPIAIGVMDFQFMGGSMGSVVGEKMTRLIEYAIKESLPLITVCASGGARMQEGSFSLMQMGKIASALNIYQRKKKLFYISILTSPTTGGVTASFGMLPNIIIAEPKAYIAFAGRRVIEQTLNLTIEDEDFQTAEYLFHHGLFDQIVPRSILKGVLRDILKLYKFH
uniref:Acetyl-coenzyme A carboxylase carboxyl transferase subunit beta, chloroplastic n=1 Tax=Araucaria bidwillii TaxID=56993 RepID=A0A5S9DM72_9CONI|nr:acetyl-CoA carboxylase carboxyltransferase beta subunit [Araucaria bidwillii]ATL59060.1 acetyl-CoA carboxylase carboxyltransferase beta subunit [Araucaria bidwillii]